ncbi:hypothetical protein ZOSMA_82G00770 [Zostera marina]|uniref:Splicing factor YJU2 n=1 Tax=Zostera marina TaxID=29655 RepID=A0A0K9NLX8_ZOSMR|nr:hypothetical protein ZOSMA_82G00770 [Zostera marina]
MGERKVLNKYYPPDFDPAKIPRRTQPKNKQMNIRMMLPMSIRCNTCGNYIYKGTKFNSRKEDVMGETYLGIQIFRFYFKCTKCSAELTMKTDPQNSDYVVESGASRNFEPWRNKDEELDNLKRKRDEEEMGDAMRALENRASDSKQDMDILAALEEMRSMKSRHATVSSELILETLRRSADKEEERIKEEDETLIKKIFHGSKEIIRRIDDDDDDSGADDDKKNETIGKNNPKQLKIKNPTESLIDTEISNASKTGVGGSNILLKTVVPTISIVKKKKPILLPEEKAADEHKAGDVSTGLQSLLANYDSDNTD